MAKEKKTKNQIKKKIENEINLNQPSEIKKFELFDYLKALTEKPEELDFENEEIRKGYQPFMINRFISMSEIFVQIVNEINKYDIPKNVHFNYFFSVLPKRRQFFNYIKKKKDLSETDKLIIANYFEVGMKEAEKYIQMLDEKQIEEILEIHRYGKNGIAGV